MFKHLLVPTDGSELSNRAIALAMRLSIQHGAKVTGLHVIPEFRILTYRADMLDVEEEYRSVAAQRAADYLNIVADAARQANVACDTVCITHTPPHEAIVTAAEQRSCDLIVMASHGRGGVRALLIGSETFKVLTHSRIPVLVIRPTAQSYPELHGSECKVSSTAPS